jgi:hypothetical protein
MKLHLLSQIVLVAGMAMTWCGTASADGRAGTVEWSDGRKLAVDVSLTPGKEIHIFTNNAPVTVSLNEVKEIRFKPEKEEMWEGFYFPHAGQATQVKTGEVYPIRYLQTQITLANGQVVAGHLMTTTFYMAKQTGANGQKLADLVYPTLIRFDAGEASAGSVQIDLTSASFTPTSPPIILIRPDLTSPPAQKMTVKPIWTVPWDDPAQLLFAVEAADGMHVAWPDSVPDPAMKQAVETGLKVMRDFYDTRTMLGCFTDPEAGDIYTLVMMKRLGKSVDPSGKPSNPDIIPWSLVVLRWKYDPDQKKATLLNRALLKIGRTQGNSPPLTVFVEVKLLRDVTGSK